MTSIFRQWTLDDAGGRSGVGQTGREGFVVLADPEGNEFCLPRTPPNRR